MTSKSVATRAAVALVVCLRVAAAWTAGEHRLESAASNSSLGNETVSVTSSNSSDFFNSTEAELEHNRLVRVYTLWGISFAVLGAASCIAIATLILSVCWGSCWATIRTELFDFPLLGGPYWYAWWCLCYSPMAYMARSLCERCCCLRPQYGNIGLFHSSPSPDPIPMVPLNGVPLSISSPREEDAPAHLRQRSRIAPDGVEIWDDEPRSDPSTAAATTIDASTIAESLG